MAMKFAGDAEPVAACDAEIDYDNEHRYAEHEHEAQTEVTPEPSREPEHTAEHCKVENRSLLPSYAYRSSIGPSARIIHLELAKIRRIFVEMDQDA
jgi:hypothetical protein